MNVKIGQNYFAPHLQSEYSYKKYSRHVKLYHNSELIGVINKYGVICCATPVDGGYWYSFADIDGIGELSLSETDKIVKTFAVKTIFRREREYYYK